MEIQGSVQARFSRVKDAFSDNFLNNNERGARFSLVIDNEVVIDIWGGTADRNEIAPFTDKTLTPVFSTTKAITALMIARLVDQGSLDYESAVSNYWPEFGQAGKSRITLGQLISHQGGLSGFSPPQDPSIWFDVKATLKALCEQTPLWAPGQGSGYHPIAGGYLLGEIFKRKDGRTLGHALQEDIAGPFGLDIMIGTPQSEFYRIADMRKPTSPLELGHIDHIKRAAFLDKGASPAANGSAEWRKMEMPSANGHATALGLARFMAIVANGGVLDAKRLISSNILTDAMRERVYGQDRVLPFRVSWGAGFMRNRGLNVYGPNENAVGHSGWGGSCAMADPDKKLSCAYVMNKQSSYLTGDPRSLALIYAVYKCL